jgi:4-amino-4-deoxy-L-arabinose transferase-like glycosyltransferase
MSADKKYKIALSILGLTAFGLILFLINKSGAGLSTDSIGYISAARNIASGHGFKCFDGVYYVLQPPLYPLLLTVPKFLFNIDPLVSAGFLNAVIFGCIVYLSGLLFHKHFVSFSLALLGVILTLVSHTMIAVSMMVYSEPLFILLILLFLYYINDYLEEGKLKTLIILSVAASLACMTRYIGVILAFTGAVGILFLRKDEIKTKIQHLFIFGFISGAPLCIWAIRNLILSNSLLGWRSGSSYTVTENVNFVYNTILPWYWPVNLTGYHSVFMLIIPAGLALVIIGYIKAHGSEHRPALRRMLPFLIFVVCYVAFLVISSATTAYDQIGERLLAPVRIATIFILLFIGDSVIPIIENRFHWKQNKSLFVCIVVIWMLYPSWLTAFTIGNLMEPAEWEYNSKVWKNNAAIQYLNQNTAYKTKYPLYSNTPEAVYAYTGAETKWCPAKTMYNSPQIVSSTHSLKGIWPVEDTVCLVWCDRTKRKYLFSLEEIKQTANIIQTIQLPDGALYILTKKEQ